MWLESLTSLSLLYSVSLKPGSKSELLFTSSSANSAAGWHACPPVNHNTGWLLFVLVKRSSCVFRRAHGVLRNGDQAPPSPLNPIKIQRKHFKSVPQRDSIILPCHPPLPPIGKMPPICSSVNAHTWFCVADSINTTQTQIIHCGDAILIDLLCWLTRLPLPFDNHLLLDMVCHQQFQLNISGYWQKAEMIPGIGEATRDLGFVVVVTFFRRLRTSLRRIRSVRSARIVLTRNSSLC